MKGRKIEEQRAEFLLCASIYNGEQNGKEIREEREEEVIKEAVFEGFRAIRCCGNSPKQAGLPRRRNHKEDKRRRYSTRGLELHGGILWTLPGRKHTYMRFWICLP